MVVIDADGELAITGLDLRRLDGAVTGTTSSGVDDVGAISNQAVAISLALSGEPQAELSPAVMYSATRRCPGSRPAHQR